VKVVVSRGEADRVVSLSCSVAQVIEPCTWVTRQGKVKRRMNIVQGVKTGGAVVMSSNTCALCSGRPGAQIEGQLNKHQAELLPDCSVCQ
jgi:hypothetical protein